MSSFLAYVQHFDIVPQATSSGSTTSQGNVPKHSTKMYILKRSNHTDDIQMGDIIPLSHIHTAVDLVPQFMGAADPHLTKETSLKYSREFLLNHFFDKQIYCSLAT
jgi:hypothetical protein